MSPKRALCDYDVYLHYRNKKNPTPLNVTLGKGSIPGTYVHQGQTFYWSGLDDILGLIVFREQDPRTL